MAKNALFHIKSPVKNFLGPAKGGGHRTVALPLNTPLLAPQKFGRAKKSKIRLDFGQLSSLTATILETNQDIKYRK